MPADEAFWNKLAERYAKQPVANPEAFQAKIRAARARLGPGDRVFEIGCGTGSLALELAPHVAEVHAMDVSGEMLRIARAKVEAAGIHNITFHQGGAEALSQFPLRDFDAVCAFSILHLVDDRDATLAQLRALMKTNAVLITSTPCLGEGLIPLGPVIALMRLFGKAPRVRIFDTAAFYRSLERAGFTHIDTPDVGADKSTAFALASC